MKQKIGTLIEEDIMRLAKRRAAQEGRPLSDLIQEALVQYLRKDAATPPERKIAYNLFCAHPIKDPAGSPSPCGRRRHVGFMNLDEIPSGSFCVLDTNVLIYAEQGLSPQAQRLLRRIEEHDVAGALPQPVWQETMHRLMVMEAVMLGHIRGANPARQLAGKPEVVKSLTIYRDKIEALVTLGLGFEPCQEADLMEEAVKIQERFGLPTNDLLIAAIALRIAADALVSADTRFQAIKEIRLYAPSDLTLPS